MFLLLVILLDYVHLLTYSRSSRRELPKRLGNVERTKGRASESSRIFDTESAEIKAVVVVAAADGIMTDGLKGTIQDRRLQDINDHGQFLHEIPTLTFPELATEGGTNAATGPDLEPLHESHPLVQIYSARRGVAYRHAVRLIHLIGDAIMVEEEDTHLVIENVHQ